MDLVNIGDLYFSNDGNVFEITDFWVDQGEPWIKYQNTFTGTEYTCLNDAFLSRFSYMQPSRNRAVPRTPWRA